MRQRQQRTMGWITTPTQRSRTQGSLTPTASSSGHGAQQQGLLSIVRTSALNCAPPPLSKRVCCSISEVTAFLTAACALHVLSTAA